MANPIRGRDQLLFQYYPRDTVFGLCRATVLQLADDLGVTESDLIHIALRGFQNYVIRHRDEDEYDE